MAQGNPILVGLDAFYDLYIQVLANFEKFYGYFFCTIYIWSHFIFFN